MLGDSVFECGGDVMAEDPLKDSDLRPLGKFGGDEVKVTGVGDIVGVRVGVGSDQAADATFPETSASGRKLRLAGLARAGLGFASSKRDELGVCKSIESSTRKERGSSVSSSSSSINVPN
jgi:hypothetical protein